MVAHCSTLPTWGGSGNDQAKGIAVDASGFAYVIGDTDSTNFPIKSPGNAFQPTFGGNRDAFVAKFEANSADLVYSTYLGGSGQEVGYAIAVDAAGEAYAMGTTPSPNFPVTPGAFQTTPVPIQSDFVSKLDAAGHALLYSTFVGGGGEGISGAIAVDSTGAAYVTGTTQSPNFPTTPGAFQPALNGAQDAYVFKLNPTGSALVYSTYLGGSKPPGTSATTLGFGIAVDSSDLAYVTGYTYTTDFPTTPGAFQPSLQGLYNAFVTKVDASGKFLHYSTYLGGGGRDQGTGIALDPSAQAYVTGYTQPPVSGGVNTFPTTPTAFQTIPGGGYDAFISKLNLPTLGPPFAITVTGGATQSTIVGTAFPNPLQVKVADASGNALPGVTVTFSATTVSGATATLSAASATTDSTGVASVTATANTRTGTYTVTASVAGVASPATFNLTNLADQAQTIAFVQQPSDTLAGKPIKPVVTVSLMDAYGNPIAGALITLSLTGGVPVFGATATTGANGIADFFGLAIEKAGTYHLQATTNGGSPTTTSNEFTITANPATLSITAASGTPQTAGAGTAFALPLKALVQDGFMNPIQGASVTFTAPSSGASVAISGSSTVTTDASGIATSGTLTANGQTGTFNVTASTGTAAPATFSLTNVAGAANKLAFMQQPTDTAAGANITPAVTVQLEDSFGNAVHTAGVSVVVQLVTGTLFGTATATTDANGLATFSSLSVQKVGTYQLLASAPSVASVTSIPFNIHAATASMIQATVGTPQSATILTSFLQPLQATVTDSFGNPVSGATVSFAAPGSGASATLGSLTATTDANGHAAVNATANGTAGSYDVAATSPGASGSAVFMLTNVTGAVGQIAFVQQPTNTMAGATVAPPVTVHVADSQGNAEVGATVTIRLGGVTGTLNGTLTATTDMNGQATFGDLNINTAGSYLLVAVSGSISTVSNAFTISATTASVTISVFDGNGQSAPVGGAYGAPLKAMVQDLYGNVLVGAAVTFSAPGSGPSVTFNGPATVDADAQGIATSPSMTASSQSGPVQVTASTPGAMTSATFNLTNLAAGTNRLAFVQQPTDTTAGAPITPPVTVQLEDSSGNALHTPGVPIALQSNTVLQRQHLFSGNATQNTDANGLATFSGLSIALVGTYQLTATTASAASATSNPFHITAGAPSVIQASGGTPQSAIINTVFGAPLQVTITDSLGNPISGVQVTFTAPTPGASGSFGGQSMVTATTDAQGHASAVITANGITGTYGVTASASVVAGTEPAVFVLTNLPGGASVLVFTQQPTNTAAGQTIAPPITVQVQDGSGHPISTAGVPVLLSLFSGTGTLFGTVVQLTDQTGTATFNDLKIGQTGSKQLRAVSTGQAPATSAVFQITAGTPVTISVFSGSPQATMVSQPFPAPLQAQVTDIGGNPVGGVAVTFALPTSSGPGGTFSGSATVVTGANGVATSPTLTANSQPGNFVGTATASGVNSQAVFALTNVPSQSPSVVINPTALTFASQINQPAPPGQTVQITANSSVTWSASSSASWLAVQPASGTGSGQFTVSVNPSGLAAGAYYGFISIKDSTGGVSVLLVTYVITNQPALVISPPVLVFTTPNNAITPSAEMLQATSSSTPIAYSVAAQVSTPSGGTWLQVTPLKGQTVGTVMVSVNPAGLSTGIYGGSVLFTPTDTTVNSVAVPVTLIVGCQQGGCTVQPDIIAVVNGASFRPTGAPAEIMTIFGTNLSDAVYQAQSYPLPTALGPTTVTANGIPVPLFYVSPDQINFEMPSGVPAGVTVTVSNGAVPSQYSMKASSPHDSLLTRVDPGLFVNTGNRAAALNQDLTPATAATPIPAGGYVLLFFTGQGPISPPLVDGTAAPATPLSLITGTVQVTVGGMPAQVAYAGVAPGFAGLSQINAIIPAGLAPGDQPVFISINGVASNAGLITVK